jgi:DNA-binding LytR/AlgR family response regulator
MDKLRIAICEDTHADLERLRTIIEQSNVPAQVHAYTDAAAFMHAFTPNFFNLVFLDVYLDGENPLGIEVAKKIRETDNEVRLALTTTSLDFALVGYSVKATQYLVKPVQASEVEALLLLVVKYWEDQNDAITVVQDGHKRTIKTNQIIYIEVQNKQCVIHLQDEQIHTYTTLDKLQSEVPSPPFLRCHRSYIVNMDHVKSIDRDFIASNGDTVYIRRGDQWKMKKAYQDYVLSQTWSDG